MNRNVQHDDIAQLACRLMVRLVRCASPPTHGSVWFILNKLSSCSTRNIKLVNIITRGSVIPA